MRNTGNTFQRLMDCVLAGVECAFPYLDDIFIFTKGEEEHRAHLMLVLQRLQGAGLAANAGKLGKSELDFLGHRVTAGGIEPLPGRVQAIADHPAPTTVKEMQNFLGVMNFYRRFVPGAARLHRPLTEALKGSPKPKAPVEWTEEMRTAFLAAKDALRSAAGLAFPRPLAELALMVDASAEHVGESLQQWAAPAAPWEPLGFFSKKLDPAQVRYSAYDRACWPVCRGSATSASCWKEGGSPSTRTTSRSPSPSPRRRSRGYLANAATSATWPSSQVTSGTSPDRKTWWQTPCRGHCKWQRPSLPWRPPPSRSTTPPLPMPSETARPSRQPGTPASPSSSCPSAPSGVV